MSAFPNCHGAIDGFADGNDSVNGDGNESVNGQTNQRNKINKYIPAAIVGEYNGAGEKFVTEVAQDRHSDHGNQSREEICLRTFLLHQIVEGNGAEPSKYEYE